MLPIAIQWIVAVFVVVAAVTYIHWVMRKISVSEVFPVVNEFMIAMMGIWVVMGFGSALLAFVFKFGLGL